MISGWIPIPIIKRYCIATTGSNGDVPPDDANCTEWEEYDTGEVEFQYVPCENEDGSGDPFLDCLMGNNPDDCTCLVYGLDCGGEDGPPPGDDEGGCNSLTSNDVQNSISSWVPTSFSNGTYDVGIESAPDLNGIITKPVIVHKDGISNTYQLGYKDRYELFFTGVIYKINNSSIWKWKTLTYSDLKLVSGSTIPCHSMTNHVTMSGPNISSDKLGASFRAHVTRVYSIRCFNGVEIDTRITNISNTYYAADYQ